jgi:hypothetical protein
MGSNLESQLKGCSSPYYQVQKQSQSSFLGSLEIVLKHALLSAIDPVKDRLGKLTDNLIPLCPLPTREIHTGVITPQLLSGRGITKSRFPIGKTIVTSPPFVVQKKHGLMGD